jgi:hypothetical protein
VADAAATIDEAAYVRWRADRTATTRDNSAKAALAIWVGGAAIVGLLGGPGTPRALVSIGIVIALIVSMFITGRRRAPTATASVFAACAASGVVGVWLTEVLLRAHAGTLGVVVLACFFQLGFTRERPAHLALAVAPAPLLALWFESRELASGALAPRDAVVETFLMLSSYAMALAMCIVTENGLRDAYRQERIIEAQRATIAKQQALLENELSHQVAERSRELGHVLAKSDVTLDARALKEGERFAERYRVMKALGAGAMGAVYEVERVTDSARLALKCVVGEVSGASAARFAREAEIGARVRHPNVVSIVDVGVSSGVPYLVMELVSGGSLEAQRSKFGDVAWALPILKQVAVGLAALHDAGVVHRDLKPANVLLTESGAKISDFGISRFGAIDDASIDANASTMAATPKKIAELTGTGVVMGTPLYMAPEAAKSARQLDASADVFALGIIAYEMLTGRSPFVVPAYLSALSGQPLVAPAMEVVPPALREQIALALSVDPRLRPRVRELREAWSAA